MPATNKKRPFVLLTIGLALIGAMVAYALGTEAADDSVRELALATTVQITTITNPPDFAAPCQRKPTETITGSGVLIDGQRVLTNAHVVTQAASIELRRSGLPDRYPAQVEHVDHECDLAILKVDDPAFFVGAGVAHLGQTPRQGARVAVYGYPLEAQTVCATEGVVSRFEYMEYVHSYEYQLAAQIDAPINPGSSGGPAFVDGKLVGLAMQKPEDTEGAGLFIPTPVIARFLEDAADGRIDGVPGLGIACQPLESPAMRKSLGMVDGQSGVYVMQVAPMGNSAGLVRPGDVLLRVDGQPVANDGTVPFGDDGRVDWSWPVHCRQIGDHVRLDLLRDGRLVPVDFVLDRDYGLLLAKVRYPDHAPYRVFGGAVFQPVDLDLAIASGDEIPLNVWNLYALDTMATAARRECVTLGRVLPHPVNQGYKSLGGEFVVSVNGTAVRDFGHLNGLLDEATGRWITLALDDDSVMVLDLPAVRAAHDEILEKYGLGTDRYGVDPDGAAPVVAVTP